MGAVACGGKDVLLLNDDRDGNADEATGGTSGETGGASGTTSVDPIANSGGAGVGGSPLGGAGVGGSLPSNCSNPNGIGVCCWEPRCMTIEEAWALSASSNPSAVDSGTPGGEISVDGGQACPGGNELPRGFCNWYRATATVEGGQCCYEYVSGSCCGRPFMVGGKQRDAGSERREDWLAAGLAAAPELDAATRLALADAWLADARLEHASIASFSRFLLHLLGLGAPAVLVERAQAAIQDEIRHARLCFSLASRYAEQPLGPGRLELTGSAESRSLAEAAADAVTEGCVGETLAALDANDRHAVSSDPDARAALEIIRIDESAHAELAWSFVQWAIAQGGAPVRRAVAAAFEQAQAKLNSDTTEPLGEIEVAAWHAHGRLTPAESLRRQRAAFREVIVPCSLALLGECDVQHEPSRTGISHSC
jgi:hypothetical protein